MFHPFPCPSCPHAGCRCPRAPQWICPQVSHIPISVSHRSPRDPPVPCPPCTNPPFPRLIPVQDQALPASSLSPQRGNEAGCPRYREPPSAGSVARCFTPSPGVTGVQAPPTAPFGASGAWEGLGRRLLRDWPIEPLPPRQDPGNAPPPWGSARSRTATTAGRDSSVPDYNSHDALRRAGHLCACAGESVNEYYHYRHALNVSRGDADSALLPRDLGV